MKNRKSKWIAAFLCMSLMAASLFGLNFVSRTDSSAAASPNGLRFKQVAAGDGFAIGLTYDNDLYGWSLLAKNQTDFDGTKTTLADYYPSVPKKIELKFVKGPTGRAFKKVNVTDGSTERGATNYVDPESDYWDLRTDDKVKYIAASADAAALVTQQGFIYTWGKETGTSAADSILLRTAYTTTGGKEGSKVSRDWYAPCIIDYNFDKNKLFNDENFIFASTEHAVVPLSLYSGEKNFYLNYGTGTPTEASVVTKCLSWGAYDNAQRKDYAATQDNIYSGIAGVHVVGGGATAAFVSGSKVYVKGKNYYLPSASLTAAYAQLSNATGAANTRLPQTMGDSLDGRVINLPSNIFDLAGAAGLQTNILKTGNFTGTPFSFNASLTARPVVTIGGQKYIINEGAAHYTPVSDTSETAIMKENPAADYYLGNFARAEGVSQTLSGQFAAAKLYNGAGTEFIPTAIDSGARRQLFALGNGYGYIIDSDGKLYAFGNNAAGQYGAAKSDGGTVLTQVNTGDGSAVTAVAAGQYRSVSIGSDTEIGTVADTALSLNESYLDKTEYISGALTGSGLYVWNKDKVAVDILGKFSVYGVKNTGKNQIATVVSGYGNNLFAISTLGKVFRVTFDSAAGDFAVTLYNEFITSPDTGAAATDNFTMKESPNRIHFVKSNASSLADPGARRTAENVLAAPQGGVVTIDALTAKLPEETEDSYCADSAAAYGAVVAANPSGDAFRILLNNEDLAGYADGTAGKVMGGAISATGNLVRFYLGEVTPANELLPGEKLDWYLKYTVSANPTTKQVEIAIYPYRATGQNKIIMTYKVGRYDCADKFTDSKTDRVFYDVFDVTTEITIANTAAVGQQITPYLESDTYDEEHLSNASVPLLDPNDESNRHYSIAITDVSTGLDKLREAVSGSKSAEFSAEIKSQLTGENGDKGFPSAAKKADTRLQYLYGADYLNAYYNDRYSYFVFDRDGDRIAENLATDITSQVKEYFAVTKNTVTLELPLTGADAVTSLSADDVEKACDIFSNTYGLSVTLSPDKAILTVTYSVITIRANKSTNSVQYANGTTLDSVQTSANFNNLTHTGRFTFKEFIPGDTAGSYVLGATGSNTTLLPLHAQASLMTQNGHNAFDNSKNEITVSRSVTVGDAGSKIEFDLSNIPEIKFNDSTNIYFTNEHTADDVTSYEAWSQYAAQFDADKEEVALSRTKLTFTPKKSETFRIRTVIRRDTRSSAGKIVPFANEDEKLYVEFVITAAPSKFVSGAGDVLKQSFASLANRMTVSSSQTVKVSDMTDLLNVKLISVNSSDTNKLRVAKSGDGLSFSMTPVASGPVKVTYSLEQYGEGFSGTINIQVESRSTHNETLSIIDKKSISLSTFRTDISQDNKSSTDIDFSQLELDTFDAAERPGEEYRAAGWYFLNPATNTVITENGGLPAFVSNVVLTKNAQGVADAFEIHVGNYNTTDNQMPSAIFVAVFKVTNNAGTEKKFEGAVYVEPKTRFLKNPDASVGGDLVMAIDMKTDSGEGWKKDSAGKIVIDRAYLTGLPCLSGLPNLDKCTIKLVTTSDEANQYFNFEYTEKTITIQPDLPVAERVPINVSISDAGTGTSYVLTFYVTVDGIVVTLEKGQYTTILFSCLGGVFALLLIIFVIRMGVYWKKKAEQKRIIKKNQMLIRMRDKVHNTSAATTREQIVKTKLKLEDPKYAKMFNDMRKDKEEQTGITLDNSVVAQKVDDRLTAEKSAKKKKKGKKSIEDLKAELDAKKAAFARMQSGEAEAMNMEPPVDAPIFDQSSFGAYADGMSREDVENQIKAKMDSGDILFDVEQVDDSLDNK